MALGAGRHGNKFTGQRAGAVGTSFRFHRVSLEEAKGNLAHVKEWLEERCGIDFQVLYRKVPGAGWLSLQQLGILEQLICAHTAASFMTSD